MKDGKTSTEQWLRIGQALEKFAGDQDWARVAQIDRKMQQLLRAQGKPTNDEERQARQALALTHQDVLAQLIGARDRLANEMDRFQQQREGVSAYRRTELSSEPDNH
ncbi:hypothetical protein FCL40_15140 [Ferrimonas sediminicola]|uniref:Protein FliT n=1 Tax=Ferrimonas sediminicola TaxID=2569538 RepID=A0A4U1BAF0_9GAMM|nr:hypothetical protein [Ferrimonas sediminicola]TKB47806.1 hypothetical protein FCL40_15140 [Ferrimonas sediminicola]